MAFSARTLVPLFGALPMVVGCYGARTARVVDARTGNASTLVVDDAQGSSGRLSGTLPNGEACFGSYGEAADGKLAVLSCGEHRLLQCKVFARHASDVGFGSCHDESGAEYDVFF